MSLFPPKSWSWWFGFKHNLHVCTCSSEAEIDAPITPNTWSSLQLLLCHPIRWWSLSYTHKCPFILIAFTMPPKRNMELIQHLWQHYIRLRIFVPISFCKTCNLWRWRSLFYYQRLSKFCNDAYLMELENICNKLVPPRLPSTSSSCVSVIMLKHTSHRPLVAYQHPKTSMSLVNKLNNLKQFETRIASCFVIRYKLYYTCYYLSQSPNWWYGDS